MARARNLKPGFFTDAELIECDHWVRLLFAGLWTIADRDGRLLDRPKQIGVDLFPRESLDIDAGLNTLADRGFIVRYEVDGQRLIWIKNFGSHQNPHKDERASTLPPPPSSDLHRACTVQAPEEPCANRAISLNLSPSTLIPDSLSPESLDIDTAPAARDTEPYTAEFETFWKAYGPTDGPKRPAFVAWRKLKPEQRAAALAGLPAWHASRKWRDGFKDYPQKYLNQRFWETVPDSGPARASPNGTGPPKRYNAYDILDVPTSDEGTLKW